MTDNEVPILQAESPPPTSNTWDQQFARLRERYPRAKDTILICAYYLQQNPKITIQELRPLAEMHGLRVTLGSLNGARRLLSPSDFPKQERKRRTPVSVAEVEEPPLAAPRRRRTAHAAAAGPDVSDLVQAIVDRIRDHAQARITQLETAVREALAAIDAELD